MKPHIKTLPCFPQVAAVIGESRAQIELFKVANSIKNDHDKIWFKRSKGLHVALPEKMPQGDKFWVDIMQGINPYHD